MRRTVIKHEFVKQIPSELEEGTLYISIEYSTAVHRCLCGCRNEVVTPLSPTDWELTFNGEAVSLDPSIGNWSYPCKSHYWIKKNRVLWDRRWSERQIREGRAHDRALKEQFYNEAGADQAPSVEKRPNRLKSWAKRLLK